MKKYTHFTENEITGEYYQSTRLRWYDHLAFFSIMLAVTLGLMDLVFGAETVTNFIADLLGSLMN